jgi:hypothetical protein
MNNMFGSKPQKFRSCCFAEMGYTVYLQFMARTCYGGEYDGPWDDMWHPIWKDMSRMLWANIGLKQHRCGWSKLDVDFNHKKTQWTTNKCDVSIFSLWRLLLGSEITFPLSRWFGENLLQDIFGFQTQCASVPQSKLRNIAALPNALKLPVTVPQPAVVFQLHERWCLPEGSDGLPVHWYGYKSKPWQHRYPKIGG